MAGSALVSLAVILLLAIGATWLAWQFRIPSILMLLLAGFLAGPVLGWVQPDLLFDDLLLPLVSLSVGIILFEGGLSLRTIELREAGGVILKLVTVGVLVTWVIAASAAYWLLGLTAEIAILLGAILVVTGPTVIIPMLRHLRPKGEVSAVLKWEGILIDPVGVILSVLVFEAILEGGFEAATATVGFTILKALGGGGLIGVAAAGLAYVMLKRYWVPDGLQSPATLAIVGGAFVAAELIQSEAGLVAATVMGVVLANQRDIAKRHIVEFKENLRPLLIGFLFIVLAARLELADLQVLSWASLAFVAVLFLIARPAAVWLSSLGSSFSWSERTFLASMAPRGIVAAALASVFALDLPIEEYPGADALVPITFLVIIATVAGYGLLAGPIGRRLGVAEPDPQGVLIVGAHKWAREFGVTLQEEGFRVVLVDTNRDNLQAAWDKGLSTQHGNSLDEAILDDLDLDGLGYLLAVTPNDEVNALTVLHFQEIFERSNVYQLSTGAKFSQESEDVPQHLRGRLLFDEELTYERIQSLTKDGWRFATHPGSHPGLGPTGDEERLQPYPLCLISEEGDLTPIDDETIPALDPQDRILVLEPPPRD